MDPNDFETLPDSEVPSNLPRPRCRRHLTWFSQSACQISASESTLAKWQIQRVHVFSGTVCAIRGHSCKCLARSKWSAVWYWFLLLFSDLTETPPIRFRSKSRTSNPMERHQVPSLVSNLWPNSISRPHFTQWLISAPFLYVDYSDRLHIAPIPTKGILRISATVLLNCVPMTSLLPSSCPLDFIVRKLPQISTKSSENWINAVTKCFEWTHRRSTSALISPRSPQGPRMS
jgi:hypothetical protein